MGRDQILSVLLATSLVAGCSDKKKEQAEAQKRAVDSMAVLRKAGKTDLSNPEMGAKVLIRLYDDSVFQSHTEIPHGQVTIAVENHGTKVHDYDVKGPSGEFKSLKIPAGGYILMAIILDKPGEYELTSPLDHDAKLDRKLTVK